MKNYKILKQYTRPIVHMRQQLFTKKFGLILGAGVSRHFRLPNWNELIQRIALNSEVDGEEIYNYTKGKGAQASVTQMLYEHYKSQQLDKTHKAGAPVERDTEKAIFKSWRKIIHTELWRDFDGRLLEYGSHPFLDSFIEIIKQSNLTINYNFDDTIQTIIHKRKTDVERRKGIKLFETVWDARLQFQNNYGIIYHPNGFLPQNLIDGSSENLVFSEDSFADQLIASMAGHYSTLLHHLSKNTCLFIGLSLEDGTLKHLLRQNASLNPGHYHYYVAYTPDKTALSAKQILAIQESNFELYNLITFFLDASEIKDLGELLQMDYDDFNTAATISTAKPIKFVFYITGAVGCGKTTTLQYFRNLATYSEWPEQKHLLLARPYTSLTADETDEVDKWVGEMFFIKNNNLRNIKEGITIIDRTPIDPLTFTDEADDGWRKKAISLNNDISSGTDAFKIVKGQIMLLRGDCDTIAGRIKGRLKFSSPEYNAADIETMYSRFEEAFKHVTFKTIDTKDLSIHQVIKKIARAIHFDEYSEVDLHSILDRFSKS